VVGRKEGSHLEVECRTVVPDPEVRISASVGEFRESLHVSVDALPEIGRVVDWGLEGEDRLGNVYSRMGFGDN